MFGFVEKDIEEVRNNLNVFEDDEFITMTSSENANVFQASVFFKDCAIFLVKVDVFVSGREI